MLTSIWEDVKRQFSQGNMVTRLIIVNAAVFVVINILKLVLHHGQASSSTYDDLIHMFCMSSEFNFFLTHPWSIITSMFMHEGFWHILINMLFLFWFGRIVSDLIGNEKILPLYLLGGIAGAIIFFLSANFLPYGEEASRYALGASAAVMAIVVASGVLAPDFSMHLILIGPVKLKYIVAVLVFLDLIGTSSTANTGGAFAHLGGALFGWFFVTQLRNGNDMAQPINKLFLSISNFFNNFSKPSKGRPSKVRVAYKNTGRVRGQADSDSENSTSHQEMLDGILDKIKKTGYDSLTSDEKEFLYNASKK